VAKKTEPAAESKVLRTVRPGFVLHLERPGPKGKKITDIYDGDDEGNNTVELTSEEAEKYAHQLEPTDAEMAQAPPPETASSV
jgi:ferredoxin